MEISTTGTLPPRIQPSDDLNASGLDLSIVSDSSERVIVGGAAAVFDPEKADINEVTANNIKEAKSLLSLSTAVKLNGQYSIERYLKLFPIESKKSSWCKHRLYEGTVQIFEIPSTFHEAIAGGFSAQLMRHTHVQYRGNANIAIGDNTVLQPDASYYLDDHQRDLPGAVDVRRAKLPKVVVEVSYHEPYSSLFALPQKYFDAAAEGPNDQGIQGVILVVFRPEGGGAPEPAAVQRFQLVALYYAFNQTDESGVLLPSLAISFGDYLHPATKEAIESHGQVQPGQLRGVLGRYTNDEATVLCDRLGLPEYRFEIPAEAMWRGYRQQDREAMGFDANPFVIDLFAVKMCVLRCYGL